MKIKYDGKIYEGTPETIVEKMNADTFITSGQLREYMFQYSRREFLWDGEGLRIETPRAFIEDLQRKELLKIIEK